MTPDEHAELYSYNLLGGVNQKSSEYALTKAQFLDLRNLDFDVVNGLQKRPGSTQAISTGTSGPITSLFEFIKLTGASSIVAGSDTAMFYMAANGLTLLSPGWNNGQPADMLTFVNKLWMANGQKFESWAGQGASPLPFGLPCPLASPLMTAFTLPTTDATFFTVYGETMVTTPGASWISRGLYAAYSYVRGDSYMGPIDFVSSARNVMRWAPPLSSDVYGSSNFNKLFGFTIPAGFGISAVAIWLGADTVSTADTLGGAAGVSVGLRGGNLGFEDTIAYAPLGVGIERKYMSLTLLPGADVSRFHLVGIVPAASLFLATTNAGVTMWASTFMPLGATTTVVPGSFQRFAGRALSGEAFNGVPFCWFDTNTPKYIDVNQNSMFMSGFSNNPSAIWYSEIGEPENIRPENSFEIRTNDGDRIFGHRSYKGQVMVFKENSFSKVIGSNPDEYELIDLSSEIGCISNATAVEYKNKLVWLDKRGIVEYNGASWDIISTPVEDIFRRMNLTAAKEKANAVHHIYRNQIWFGIPLDDSTVNNFTVVYDYLVGAWTFFDGYSPSAYAFIKSTGVKQTAWRGDYSGMIHYFGESFFGDGANAITCMAFTKFENSGGQNVTSTYRRFFLDVAEVEGASAPIIGQVFSNYNRSTVKHTFTMTQGQYQTRNEMGIQNAKAVAVRISHSSASLPLLINGFTWAARNEREV